MPDPGVVEVVDRIAIPFPEDGGKPWELGESQTWASGVQLAVWVRQGSSFEGWTEMVQLTYVPRSDPEASLMDGLVNGGRKAWEGDCDGVFLWEPGARSERHRELEFGCAAVGIQGVVRTFLESDGVYSLQLRTVDALDLATRKSWREAFARVSVEPAKSLETEFLSMMVRDDRAHAENPSWVVLTGDDAPDGEMALARTFLVHFEPGHRPTSIRAEEVSGPEAVLVLDDQGPELDDSSWYGQTESWPLLPFLADAEPGTSYFRLTIEYAQGETSVLEVGHRTDAAVLDQLQTIADDH